MFSQGCELLGSRITSFLSPLSKNEHRCTWVVGEGHSCILLCLTQWLQQAKCGRTSLESRPHWPAACLWLEAFIWSSGSSPSTLPPRAIVVLILWEGSATTFYRWKGFSVSHVRMRNGAVRAVVEATNLGFWGEVKIGDLYLGVVRVGWI